MKSRASLFGWLVSVTLSSCDAPPVKISNVVLPTTPRITLSAAMSDSVVSAGDFAMYGNRLYVLDHRSRNVWELSAGSSGWQHVRTIGRAGQGPGELSSPIALEYDSLTDRLIVFERDGEIETFDSAGAYLESELVTVPCASAHAQVVSAGPEILIAQRCIATPFERLSADTAYMILASVAPGRLPRLLAAQAVSTRRGEWGSIFVASWPVAVGNDSIVFGGGVGNCLFSGPADLSGTMNATCYSIRPFSAPKPKNFDSRRFASKAAAWPDPLPPFVAVTYSGDEVLLVRAISADSVVFESLRASGQSVLVAPLNSLVGCKAAGCLWYDDREGIARAHFLSADSLANLLRSSRRVIS